METFSSGTCVRHLCYNNAMNKAPHHLLTDVVALSQQLCDEPIAGKLLYATDDNFVGRVLDGYSADAQDVCLLAKQTAAALCKVQNYLLNQNRGLLIYDAYRPLRAVKDYGQWFHQPVTNEKEIERKRIHYPDLEKHQLAEHGYITENKPSKHNYGHAVDVVLIDINTQQPVNMGACFDYFGERSHATATQEQIGKEAFNNRFILSTAMQKFRFNTYIKEYWHYEYHLQESDQPIDLPIDKSLKNLNVSLEAETII